jgi:hypothetical protein
MAEHESEGNRDNRGSADQVAADHDRATIPAVDQRSGRQAEEQIGEAAETSQEPCLCRLSGEGKREQREGQRDRDAFADGGNDLAAEQQEEVAAMSR